MNAVIEKIQGFFDQFGSEEEFVGWCEVQGVKGVQGAANNCLVAEAVRTATGHTVSVVSWDVTTGEPYWRDHAKFEKHALPSSVRDVPWRFDQGEYPSLIWRP